MSRLLRGLAALATLVGLVSGVPYALVRFVGRPWPRPFPPVAVIATAIRSGDISDATVIKALAIIVWIAWARISASLVIEIAARLAGAQAPHIVGLGSAQRWAATLVAAVVLMVGAGPRLASASSGSAASVSARRPVAASVAGTEHIVAIGDAFVSGSSSGGASSSGVADGADPTVHVHVVARHESFWSIAHDALGDGSRWRELLRINEGHEVAPGVMFDGTARRLLPGWTLLVPGSTAATHGLVEVQRGDSLSSIAAQQLGDADEWPEIWDANRGHEFDGRTFDNPNLILTGWELVVPEVMAPSIAGTSADPPVTPPPESSTPTPTPTPTPARASAVPAPQASASPAAWMAPKPIAPRPHPHQMLAPPDPTRHGLSLSSAPLQSTPVVAQPAPTIGNDVPQPVVTPPPTSAPAETDVALSGAPTTFVLQHDDSGSAVLRGLSGIGGLGGAVLVSSGVIGALEARRRRQLRSAGVDAQFAEPSQAAANTETVLRRLDDGERMMRLDIALRSAATSVTSLASGVGVLGVIAGRDGQLDLLLTGAATPAVEPWTAVTPHRWRLAATVDVVEIADTARRSGQPCPALAHLGSVVTDSADVADLFVDLEAIGLLVVDAPDGAADIVRAIATGLAVSPLAEIAHLVSCGLPETHLGHPLAQEATSLDAALDLAANAIGSTASMTSASVSTFMLRSRHHGGEAWEPAVIVAVGTAPDDDVDRDVRSLTAPAGRGLAIVVDRPISGADWRIEHRDHRWLLHPLGLEFVPVGLSPGDVRGVSNLLEAANAPLTTSDSPQSEAGSAASTDSPSLDWSLLVRVLGGVEVVDRELVPVDFERSKALELVVWLSQHRDRATRAGARTALWESDVRDATFANVVSDARRALARRVTPAEGDEWLGRTLTEQLPLHRLVVTDADILRDRLAVARRQTAVEAIETLRPALALVRDLPFSGNSYLWPETEGISSQLILLVTSAATVLANHYLAFGDTEGVFWATGQGLKVLPGHEELIALRMRAHGRHGDLAGVRQEWEMYERVLLADAWCDNEPSSKLVALRRELLSPNLAVV